MLLRREISSIISSYNVHSRITDIEILYQSKTEFLAKVKGIDHDDGAYDSFSDVQYYKKFGNSFSRCNIHSFSDVSKECLDVYEKYVSAIHEKDNTQDLEEERA